MEANHPAQALAYLGDAVFELKVREMLLAQGARPVDALNQAARRYVTATAQAAMYHRIAPLLTDEEQAILRRGRNLHGGRKMPNIADYRHATGLETLFGYLHANGMHTRLAEVFALCTNEKSPSGPQDSKSP